MSVERLTTDRCAENLASARIVLLAPMVAARPKRVSSGKTGRSAEAPLTKFPSRLAPALRRPKDARYAFETVARASATVVESGVVGRPIRAESWRPLSNSAPSAASASQLATAFAVASGRPNPTSAVAYSGTGKFL